MKQIHNWVASLHTWQTNYRSHKQNDKLYTNTKFTVYVVINITKINTIKITQARAYTHTHIREYVLLIAEMFRNVATIFGTRIHATQKCCYSVITQFVLVLPTHPRTRVFCRTTKQSTHNCYRRVQYKLYNTTPQCLEKHWKVSSSVNTLGCRFSRVRTSWFRKFAGSLQE